MKKTTKETKNKSSIFRKKKTNKALGERDPKKKLLTAYGWKMLTESF